LKLQLISKFIDKVNVVKWLIWADWNTVRVSVGKPIPRARAKTILASTIPFHTAIVAKSNIVISSVRPVGSAWVHEYANYEIFM
jgi:hypothetical protein